MGVVFAKTILEFSNQKLQKFVQTQIEQFYKQGAGVINHGLTVEEKKLMKKSDKDLGKKMKKIDNSALSR